MIFFLAIKLAGLTFLHWQYSSNSSTVVFFTQTKALQYLLEQIFLVIFTCGKMRISDITE